VKDARALRRKLQTDFMRAKVAMNVTRSTDKEKLAKIGVGKRELIDPNMCYSALNGYDKLSFDPKCGFDIPQLERLFPEQMNNYQRWSKMHQAFKKSEEGEDAKVAGGNDGNNNESMTADDDKAIDDKNRVWVGGHLEDRLAQFDLRTQKMVDQWYLTFSQVRQGSFISKEKHYDDRQWTEYRRKMSGGKRGRKTITWESLHAATVQFLHWLGFNQRSALAPPNEETSQALAFLGYDFMGKLIEKAILLRFLTRREASPDEETIVLELRDGEQLEVEDIQRALDHDTTLNTIPLYNAADSPLEGSELATQLYFGPGFEDRLEIELEHITAKNKKVKRDLSEDERKTRMEEDKLFNDISKPPKLLKGILDVLGDDVSDDVIKLRGEAAQALATKRKCRPRKKQGYL